MTRYVGWIAVALLACGRVGFEPLGSSDAALTGSCGATSCACTKDCDVACLSGRCDVTCEFATCMIHCNDAPCDILCNAANCNYECGAGGCTVRIILGGDAIGTCTQDCTESCDTTAGTCMQTCDLPATCRCTGDGCP